MEITKEALANLEKNMPDIFARKEVGKLLGSVDTNFDINKKMGIFILEKNSNKGVENENTHDYRRTI